MSGQQKNPLLKSNYSVKIDTKSSLLATSTTRKPKTQERHEHVTGGRLARQLSDKPKTISTPSIKLVGTTPKLSDKYAVSTRTNEKLAIGKIAARTTTGPKTETLSKSSKPVSLRSTKLQTKSLLLSATKSGLLTTKKSTTTPLTSSPRLSATSSKDIGKYSTKLLSGSYSAPSTITSLKTSQPIGKTSRSSASAVQKHSHRQGAAGKDDTDDAAAPHYDLKLETTRSDGEDDEVETFLPPELDPSIHEPTLPIVNVIQVINCQLLQSSTVKYK